MECSFQHLSVQKWKGFASESGLFQNSCLAKCPKMLSFANFENEGTYIKIGSLHALLNSLSIS